MSCGEKNKEKYTKHQFDLVDFQTKFLSNFFDLMWEWGTDFTLNYQVQQTCSPEQRCKQQLDLGLRRYNNNN